MEEGTSAVCDLAVAGICEVLVFVVNDSIDERLTIIVIMLFGVCELDSPTGVVRVLELGDNVEMRTSAMEVSAV